MTKENRLKARKLFHQLERYEILKDLAEHASGLSGMPIRLFTSPRNQVKIQDTELAKLILDYAEKKLLTIEGELANL